MPVTPAGMFSTSTLIVREPVPQGRAMFPVVPFTDMRTSPGLTRLRAYGVSISGELLWTFVMPTDHATVSLTNVKVRDDDIFGVEGDGLKIAQRFFHENRIRQAAASLGAAQYCVNESIEYAKRRSPFGKPLSSNQAIQFPLVELQAQCEMVRALLHKTAWLMDKNGAASQGDKIAMLNFWSNRLCSEAADRAIQVHGALGYSRHKPFEHIYRHYRRYRITEGTEGTEEIQLRRAAGYLFGFLKLEKGQDV